MRTSRRAAGAARELPLPIISLLARTTSFPDLLPQLHQHAVESDRRFVLAPLRAQPATRLAGHVRIRSRRAAHRSVDAGEAEAALFDSIPPRVSMLVTDASRQMPDLPAA